MTNDAMRYGREAKSEMRIEAVLAAAGVIFSFCERISAEGFISRGAALSAAQPLYQGEAFYQARSAFISSSAAQKGMPRLVRGSRILLPYIPTPFYSHTLIPRLLIPYLTSRNQSAKG